MAEHESEDGSKRQIFIYMDDWPHATGSGAHLRFRSNVQAWVDLGYEVEVLRVAEKPADPPNWPGVLFTALTPEPGPSSFWGKVQYRLAWPGRAALPHHFTKHTVASKAVVDRMQRYPEAWHMLEGDSLGNVAPLFPSRRLLFSHHDLCAEGLEATYRSVAESDQRPLSSAEKREVNFIRAAELHICRHSRLVLCISDHDREVLQTRHGISHATYFPMSVHPETCIARPGTHGKNELRLLHTGKVSHLPSYRSLEFIFQEVFPRLKPEVLQRLRLRIVGTSDGSDNRTRRIREMGEPYRNILEWSGFLPDLEPSYEWADLQIVASTDVSGLRTRIVESLARGLPVLSTPRAARGLGGLSDGENILLTETPETCAAALERLVNDPGPLAALAQGGRELYLRQHSQKAVSARLKQLLEHL